jgi:steroid 5-alpha reductase family enzyme
MSLVEIYGMGVIFCLLLMFLAWLISFRINFYSLVDVIWAYGIGALVILFASLSNGILTKKLMAVAMALMWSIRLGTYLALRLRAHYPSEDRRYLFLKNKWGIWRFFVFFQFQGISQAVFALPFLFLTSDSAIAFSALTVVGALIFLLGFFGEALADKQLNQFRSSPKNRGKVCDIGLWKYSRHPNYFFEWLIWCGISSTALSSSYGFIGLISPISMYLTLNYLTGVPAAEEQSLKSKGHLYREYQKRTNRFFPWSP